MEGLRRFLNGSRREEARRQRTVEEEDAVLALHTRVGQVLADYMRRTKTNGIENGVYRLQQEVNQIQSARAEQKAKELLYAHLTPEQQAEYGKRGVFFMNGRTNEYQIERGGRAYVKLDNRWRYLCIASTDSMMPSDDQTLATKLYIEGNEEEFLQIANLDGAASRHVNVNGKIVDNKGREVTDLRDLFGVRAYYDPYLIDGNLARRLNEIANPRLNGGEPVTVYRNHGELPVATWEEDPLPF